MSPDITKCLWGIGAKLHPVENIAIMTNDTGHLFMGLFAIDILSLVKCLLKSFVHFFKINLFMLFIYYLAELVLRC